MSGSFLPLLEKLAGASTLQDPKVVIAASLVDCVVDCALVAG